MPGVPELAQSINTFTLGVVLQCAVSLSQELSLLAGTHLSSVRNGRLWRPPFGDTAGDVTRVSDLSYVVVCQLYLHICKRGSCWSSAIAGLSNMHKS